MELIIEFYQGLDTLNLIIFWGIIIVIVLLLIFSCILINKNKKLKQIVDDSKKKEEELPIKKLKLENNENLDDDLQKLDNQEIILPTNQKNIEKEKNIHLETEKKFVAEEHVKKYNNHKEEELSINKTNEEIKQENRILEQKRYAPKEIEIPNKPYQRNVLREMSLSQTSPIGITRPVNKEDKKLELAKDLEDTLNKKEEEITRERNIMQNEVLKKELTQTNENTPRKTEIKLEEKRLEKKDTIPKKEYSNTYEGKSKEERNYILTNTNAKRFEEISKIENLQREVSFEKIQEKNWEKNMEEEKNKYIPPQVKELLDKTALLTIETNTKSSSERYLEEVSKKLAEAEIPDEIERTNYELEQEENAIISYKELMEKKDSIQTIDEEEAIISIEELMNKSSNLTPIKEEKKEETKLYNLTEEEENDNFLKELKQFRNDL